MPKQMSQSSNGRAFSRRTLFHADNVTAPVCCRREQHRFDLLEPAPRDLARVDVALRVAAAEPVSAAADKRLVWQIATAQGTNLDASVLAVGSRAERHPAGTVLFKRGDKGDAASLLLEGEVEMAEFQVKLGQGQVFGEVALLSPDGVRTATVVCITDVELYRIDASAFGRAFYQDPAFAFALVRLTTGRLLENISKLGGRSASER